MSLQLVDKALGGTLPIVLSNITTLESLVLAGNGHAGEVCNCAQPVSSQMIRLSVVW